MTYRRILALGMAVSLTACEGNSPSDTEAASASATSETTTVQAGEPIELSSRVPTKAEWRASAGVVFEADSSSWFLPPMDDGEYVVRADTAGSEIYRLEVAVEGVHQASLSSVNFGSDGLTEGEYGGVSFRARKTTDGAGEATFSLGDQTLVSTVTSDDRGNVSWMGTMLDGVGELSAAEQVALDSLARSGFRSAVTFVPLDLACLEGAENVDPVVGAAIVQPWQLLLKYLASYPAAAARHYAGMAACEYFPDVTTSRDSNAVSRLPSPNVMVLNNESPLPAAIFHFPLDGQGALSAPSMATSN